jgi:hypothetical protein
MFKMFMKQKKIKNVIEERLVLTALDFDINIHHLYKPLMVIIRKF